MNKTTQPHAYVLVTTGGSVELADKTDGKFNRYWKQIAKFGDFVDPRGGKEPMKLDKTWADKIVSNFKSGVRGYIPVPLGHPQSDAELADLNRGELVDAEARDDGLYGLIEIRDNKTAEAIDSKQIPDVSVAFDDDYQDKKTGDWVGATLKHVGLVVNPYLKGMTQFEPVQMSDSAATAAVLFSDSAIGNGATNNNEKEQNTMDTVDVKNDKDFDIDVKYTATDGEQTATVKAGESVTVPKDQEEAVKKQIADAVDPEDAADGGADEDQELSEEQKKKAKELSDRETALATKEAQLAEKEAETTFATLLSEGKVVPAQKDAFIALSKSGSTTVELSDGKSKTVQVLLSEFIDKTPKGKYLSEQGKENEDGKGDDDEEVQLTDEEKSYAEDFGNTPEEIAEFKKTQESNKERV